jgi:hypothetical protein
MWAAGDPLGGAAHEPKVLHLSLVLYQGAAFSRATNRPPIFREIKSAAKPRALYQGLASAGPKTRPPIFRETKYAANPRSNPASQSLIPKGRAPGQRPPQVYFEGPTTREEGRGRLRRAGPRDEID